MAEKYTNSYNKPWKKLTRPELMAEIGRLTTDANYYLDKYADTGKEVPTQLQGTLTDIRTLSKSKEGMKLQTGGLTRKKKAQLLVQARELQSFTKYAGIMEGQEEDLKEKAWQTFHRKHRSWSREEYDNVAEILGALGDSLVAEYGSTNLIKYLRHKTVEQRSDILNVAKKVVKKETVVTRKDAMDELSKTIREMYNTKNKKVKK